MYDYGRKKEIWRKKLKDAQDESFWPRWIKHYTDKKTTDSLKCKMCRKMDENVTHLVSECNELAQMSTWNSGMIKLQHCCTCSSARLMDSRRIRNIMNTVEKEMRILENDKVKILWEFSIQTETKIDHNKSDLILLEKKEGKFHIISPRPLDHPLRISSPLDLRYTKVREKSKISGPGKFRNPTF